jgi:enamine deaminase RidA (YjgF/YER057c/UK114 family)
MFNVYARLEELGLTLPQLPPKGGIYKPVMHVGNFLYVSGQGATIAGVPSITGKVGRDRTVEEGQEAAKLCVMNALATLHNDLGDLNRIKQLVKLLGFVQSSDEFFMQPKVMDGASALLRDIWDEAGIGARSAIGVNALPGNISVEIEFIFTI